MKLTPRKRHITITPLLETHRHIYRLSGIQANLASILFDRRSDDTSAQLLITILTDVHSLIEHLNAQKESL